MVQTALFPGMNMSRTNQPFLETPHAPPNHPSNDVPIHSGRDLECWYYRLWILTTQRGLGHKGGYAHLGYAKEGGGTCQVLVVDREALVLGHGLHGAVVHLHGAASHAVLLLQRSILQEQRLRELRWRLHNALFPLSAYIGLDIGCTKFLV